MDNNDLLEKFSEYLRKRHLSANTISSYLGSVRLYLKLYVSHSPSHLRDYRRYLIRHYQASTVNQRIHGVNHFSTFYESLEPTFTETANLRLPAVKVQQKTFLDTVISNEDYLLLKQKLQEEGQFFWYFVVRFLASTGSRVSELVQIKKEHIDLGYLDLCSKGGKVRRIYFPDSLCEEADLWCRKQNLTSGFLFLGKTGRPVTPRGVRFQLKHFAIRYGIDPDTVYPHSFRHRFAKNFLERFHDIALLSDLLGHESIETTRIYLTKSSKEQKELIDEIVTW